MAVLISQPSGSASFCEREDEGESMGEEWRVGIEVRGELGVNGRAREEVGRPPARDWLRDGGGGRRGMETGELDAAVDLGGYWSNNNKNNKKCKCSDCSNVK